MTDLGNQHDDDGDHASRILGQPEIDAMNMKELNQANRYYRKCLSGKCPPVVDRRAKITLRKRPKNLISKIIQDKKLSLIWVESGRDRRCKIMEAELMELNKRIKVAKGKTHRTVHENNFKAIERAIKDIEKMNVQITQAKSEITHIKSQIDRVAQKKTELSRETESEGEKFRLLCDQKVFSCAFQINFKLILKKRIVSLRSTKAVFKLPVNVNAR
jgi:septal ring factor EnvC (AmiA/AmiB activator)